MPEGLPGPEPEQVQGLPPRAELGSYDRDPQTEESLKLHLNGRDRPADPAELAHHHAAEIRRNVLGGRTGGGSTEQEKRQAAADEVRQAQERRRRGGL